MAACEQEIEACGIGLTWQQVTCVGAVTAVLVQIVIWPALARCIEAFDAAVGVSRTAAVNHPSVDVSEMEDSSSNTYSYTRQQISKGRRLRKTESRDGMDLSG